MIVARKFKGYNIAHTLESGGLQLVVQTDHASPVRVGERAHVQLEGRAGIGGSEDISG